MFNFCEVIVKTFTACTIQASSNKFAGMPSFVILNSDDISISIKNFFLNDCPMIQASSFEFQCF